MSPNNMFSKGLFKKAAIASAIAGAILYMKDSLEAIPLVGKIPIPKEDALPGGLFVGASVVISDLVQNKLMK